MLREENTCNASLKYIPSSTYKWNLIAGLIRNLPAKEAIAQLSFCKKGGAGIMKKLLLSCMANGENNHGLDLDKVFVYRVLIGKAFTLRRFMACGRGRSSRIEKRYSKITIILKQENNSIEAKKQSKTKKSNS